MDITLIYHRENIHTSSIYNAYPYPWVLEELGVTGKELFNEHLKILEAKNVTLKNITAFMAETFQGWAAVFYPIDYIKELRKWTQENDILLIFDEIQSGFGRTGTRRCLGACSPGPRSGPSKMPFAGWSVPSPSRA